MHIKHILASLLIVTLFSVWGCSRKQSAPKSFVDSLETNQNTEEVHHPQYHNLLTNQTADTVIACSGVLEIAFSNKIRITPPASGIVSSIDCIYGSYVQAGTILATLENVDFLKLQQEYLEARSQYFFYGEELKRQGVLTIENASSVKKLQLAQLAYQLWETKTHSLAQQLTLLGFKPDSIDVEHFSPLISIYAPESGYIHRIIATKGRKVSPGDRLLEMVRENKPVLFLEIPEQYYSRLQIGQKLIFNLHGDTAMVHKAKLTYFDNYIETDSHIVRVIAKPENHSLHYIPGMRIRAELYLKRD